MINNKLLVIVPYRNRESHLKEFIPYISQTLKNQKIDYKIVIVEQYDTELFNRGLLCNIGFDLFGDSCDYICIHDIDVIGENFNYRYADTPTHLSAKSRDKNYIEWYINYLGGVVLFPKRDFIYVNGFSNNYWGWGCEDDDLKLRCDIMSIKISRRNCKYFTLKHESIGEHLEIQDRIKLIPGYKKNFDRLSSLRQTKDKKYILDDGLSNVKKYFNTHQLLKYDEHTIIQVKVINNEE